MSRFVPVSFEKWAEMVKARSDLVRYKEMCDELDAECTRLKAEVERLTAVFVPENLILRADVERLTKAGDAMAVHLAGCYRSEGYDPKNCRAIDIWNAAKEGKQP